MPCNFRQLPINDNIHAVYPELYRSELFSSSSNTTPRYPQHFIMDVRPIEETLTKVITNAIPETQIQSLRAIASPGLHQVYRATLQDGGVIVCSLPQSRNRRVLRCEYGSIRSEAAILQWLSSLCGGRPKLGSSKSPAFDFEDKKELRNRLRAQALSSYLPNLLEHGTTGSMQRLQYNVTSTRPGEVLASLCPPLTAAQHASVDFQIGQMLRAISLIHSPTFQFGNAETILPPVPERSSWEQRRASVQMTSESFTRWSDAFGELLNGAIQDAQSNQITASYDSIRRFHRRFAHVLDAVVEPRLVLIDAGTEKNVLVSLQESESGTCDKSDGDSDFSNKSGTSDKSGPSICQVPKAKVAGLREWTKPIFGDPLLSVVLCQAPSKNIVQGFSSPLVNTPDDMDEVAEGLSQKRQYSQIRLNLYRVYHALNAISIEYIRRDDGSDPRELRARKALVDAIRELEVLEEAETSKRRRRRLEVAPSKRPRTSSP